MTDMSNFESRVIYEMEGWMREDIDPENFTRATEATVTERAELKFDEELFANIINLDSFLRNSWSERMASEIDLDNGRTFIPEWSNVTVRLDIRSREIVEAAEKRAAEDGTESAYVLGNWVYLANKANHIQSCLTLRSAFDRVKNRGDQPDDATSDEYLGGRN